MDTTFFERKIDRMRDEISQGNLRNAKLQTALRDLLHGVDVLSGSIVDGIEILLRDEIVAAKIALGSAAELNASRVCAIAEGTVSRGVTPCP